MAERRHGETPDPGPPPPVLTVEDREAWDIACLLSAPLPVCPYTSRFAPDDPEHPCHAMCREEC